MNCNFDVHCTTIPFDKECLDYCMEQILRNITPEEKQLILGLDKILTEKIFSLYNSRISIRSFRDLERNLTEDEVETIKSVFSRINQFQLNYFRKSIHERQDVIKAIKLLDLDADENI